MAESNDTVWLPVLPSMSGFGPALVKQAGRQADKAGRGIGGKLGGAMVAGVAAAGVGAAAFGTMVYQAGRTFEDLTKTIQVGTGASGKALEGLKSDAKAIGQEIPASFDDIGQSVASLNTYTGASGEDLQALSKQVLEASRILGEDGVANSEAFGQAMQQWQIPVEEGPGKVDALFKATQDYGMGLGEVTSHLNEYGSVLQNAGFSMDESAALFGQLESSGLSVSRVMPGLNMAFRTWSEEGKNSQQELERTVERMKNAGSETEALKIATEEFGAEGAQRMTTAVRSGALQLDDLSKALSGADGAVAKTAESTMTWTDQWDRFKNNVLVWLEPLATRTMGLLADGMGNLVDGVRAFVDAFTGAGEMDEQGGFVGFLQTLGEYARDLVPRLRDEFMPVIEMLGQRVRDVASWFRTDAIPALKTFGQWVLDNRTWLSTLAVTLGGALAAWRAYQITVGLVTKAKYAMAAAQRAMNMAMRANPIGLIITAIGGLVAGLTWLFTKTEWGQEVWSRVWGWMKETASSVSSWFMETAVPWLTGAWDNIVSFFQTMWVTWLRPVFTGLQSVVSSVAAWFMETAVPWLKNAWSAVVSGFQWFWENIGRPVFNAVRSVVQSLASWFMNTAMPWIRNAWQGLVESVQWFWQNILKPVFDAVGSIVTWLYENIVLPYFGLIRSYIRTVFNAIDWVWQNILRPAINAVGAIFSWLWENVARPLFGFIGDAWNALVAGIKWYWENVLSPVISLVGDIFRWLWENVAEPVFGWISDKWETMVKFLKWYWENGLKPTLSALGDFFVMVWNDYISPAIDWISDKWDWLSDKISEIWEDYIKPAISAFSDFVKNDLVEGIEKGVDWAKDAWETLRSGFAKPINFVIDTVWNDGLRKAWNTVADLLPGVEGLDRMDTIDAYAKGGRTKAGLALVGEEGPELVQMPGGAHVSTAAETRQMLAGRYKAAGKDVPEGQEKALLGSSPSRAMLPAGNFITDAFKSVGSFLGDLGSWAIGGLVDKATELVFDPVMSKVRDMVGGGGGIGDIITGFAKKAISGMTDFFSDKDAQSGSGDYSGAAQFDGPRGRTFRPSAGPVTSRYGARWGGVHEGIDIAGGGPVFAPWNGRVVAKGKNIGPGRTGNGVLLSHGGSMWSYFGHNPWGGIPVSVGDEVKGGQRIGAQGATGNVTGVHTHAEVHTGRPWSSVDPAPYLLRDTGGVLPEGYSNVLNSTGGAEYVQTERDFRNTQRLLAQVGADESSGGGLAVHLHGIDQSDARSNVTAFAREERRMRRGGAHASANR